MLVKNVETKAVQNLRFDVAKRLIDMGLYKPVEEKPKAAPKPKVKTKKAK